MKLEEVLPSFRAGKMIYRKSWEKHSSWRGGGLFEMSSRLISTIESSLTSSHIFTVEDALADDWEIIDDI